MSRQSLDWKWSRSIIVGSEISDDLVVKLAPEILRLKESNNDPITIGIDSVGGSVIAMEQILALLKTPNTKGEIPEIVGVGINKVFSSAATLLAMCDYAVALPSSQILFHDIRYSQAYDVTPSVASKAAKDLRGENDRIALKLALKIIERLTWIWIDLKKSFGEARKNHADIAAKLDQFTQLFPLDENDPRLDLGGFIAAIYSRTSNVADHIVLETLEKLEAWKKFESAFQRFETENKGAKTDIALFQDTNPLISAVNATFSDSSPFTWSNKVELKKDLTLLLLLLISACKNNDNPKINDQLVEKLMSEFSFSQEMRSADHVNKVVEILQRNDRSLFGFNIKERISKLETEKQVQFIQNVFFQTQILWAFVLVFSRGLFSGEHRMSNHDALFLGLVDEIAGITDPEPRRLYRNRVLKSESKTKNK